MKFAICNETFGDMPLADALAMAALHGYTGWEVAPFMLGNAAMPSVTGNGGDWIARFDQDARRKYRDAVESSGLSIIGLHWLLAKTEGFHLTTQDGAVRERTSGYLGQLAQLCCDLGGDVMVLGSPGQRNFPADQSPESAMHNAAEVLRGVVPSLEQYGVRIAIEPLGRGEGNFLNTTAEGRQLVDMVSSPQVRLHLDVKAMSDEALPIDQNIRDHADAMIHFHANDPNLLGPGMGEVEFKPIVAALKEIGYDGWISVEVFDYSPGIETLVRTSIENLRSAGD